MSYIRDLIKMNHTMATVALRGMKFYAYHGYYEYERKIGNNFTVDVEIKTDLEGHPNEQIESTVNYEVMYDEVRELMALKYKLLESLAYDMAQRIKALDIKIKYVRVQLIKHNPPVGGNVNEAVVAIEI